MLHAVIMAGGSGTRFWPVSRRDRPKQLIALAGERTMIQMTVDRLQGLVGPEQTLIVTNQRLVEPIQEQLPELPAMSVIGEPCKRDTAPCIGLAALLLLEQDPEAVMLVMPADHVIRPEEDFQSAVQFAASLVASGDAEIATFGIRPTYPAEIFGYIQGGEPISDQESGMSAFAVANFREKPGAETAREYLAGGDYYWNSGIFLWKASTIMAALEEHQPTMVEHLRSTVSAWKTNERDEVFQREFAAIEGISVDYAVMEHAKNVVVVEAPFEWDDVGGWQAMARLRNQDERGNTVIAKHLAEDTSGCIVRSEGEHLIVTLGLEDCLVVHTPNVTLVADKNREESIRKLVAMVEENGWQEYL
ncbi:MAG: mannose-1-phosphate guanylyltransferase [Pirellulales bacterium]|nr:mannose-1-phosphate guanylyltransferase [Pirellulales bacterium]